MEPFSSFNEQLQSRLVWFPELEEQCLGANLIDFGDMSTFSQFVNFIGDCSHIEACHYFLQHFCLKRRGNGFPALLRESASFIFLFCFMLLHKKGAVPKWCSSSWERAAIALFWKSAFESMSRFSVEKLPSSFLFQKFLLSESLRFSYG